MIILDYRIKFIFIFYIYIFSCVKIRVNPVLTRPLKDRVRVIGYATHLGITAVKTDIIFWAFCAAHDSVTQGDRVSITHSHCKYLMRKRDEHKPLLNQIVFH
jgi:hypothetical protein